MNRKVKWGAAALSCLMTVCMAVPSVSAAQSRTLYEDFENYTDADYQQTIKWSSVGPKGVCKAGSGVAPGSNKSVEVDAVISDESINFWMKHGFDKTKQNWTGAKYVQIYIQNLTGKENNLGFMITDITDNDEKKQEHFQITWNSAVVLEDMSGNKTKVVSNEGMAVTIPANFKGSMLIPLNSDTLEIPGWLYSEADYSNYANYKLDLNSIFKVSPIIPKGNSGAKFLIDDIYWSTSNDVDNFLNANGQTATTAAKQSGGDKSNKANTASGASNAGAKGNTNQTAAVNKESSNTGGVIAESSADTSEVESDYQMTVTTANDSTNSSAVQAVGEQKSNKPLIIGIVIAMVVIVAGGATGIILVMKKGKPETK